MWMKRTVLLLFMSLVLLTGCYSPVSIPVIEPADNFVPIQGISEQIIASGYFEILEFRYSPNPSHITFHPYPGYYHLFPFAALNGVPHISLTNCVDSFFELLGIERDDVPADRFGNQEIHNVTAMFDNFTRLDIERFNIVYAEAVAVIDDWQGDKWEIVHPDFIFFTNGDSSIEPFEMRVGDEFLELILTRIESSRAFLKNGETYYQLSAEAEMSGEITLGGDLSIGLYFDSDYRVRVGFTVADEYLPSLPKIADFGEGFNNIPIWNTDEVMSAIGVSRGELDNARNIEFSGVTVIIKITWVSTYGYDAHFVELQNN
jgi:hypothetical protein